MKFAFACLLGAAMALTGCAGTAGSSGTPPVRSSTSTPAPPNAPSAPSATPHTTPTTTPTPPTTPPLNPITPTPTPTTPPATPTSTTTTTAPAVSGTWTVSLTTTTGTPSLAFTVALQQAANGTITGTGLAFTRASSCFGANTTVTGQASGNTVTLTLTSTLANGSSNVLQLQLVPTSNTTMLTGTYAVQPATGNPGCGVEAGTVTMTHM